VQSFLGRTKPTIYILGIGGFLRYLRRHDRRPQRRCPFHRPQQLFRRRCYCCLALVPPCQTYPIASTSLEPAPCSTSSRYRRNQRTVSRLSMHFPLAMCSTASPLKRYNWNQVRTPLSLTEDIFEAPSHGSFASSPNRGVLESHLALSVSHCLQFDPQPSSPPLFVGVIIPSLPPSSHGFRRSAAVAPLPRPCCTLLAAPGAAAATPPRYRVDIPGYPEA